MNIAIVNFCQEGRRGLDVLYKSLVAIITSVSLFIYNYIYSTMQLCYLLIITLT